MGSKHLKAIVVLADGELRPSPADAERFEFVVYEATKLLKANPITSQALPEFGTSVLVNVLDQAGAFPTRNFRESRFEHAEAISGEALRKGYTTKRTACRGCQIGCARRTATGSESGEGPEYETIWALGAACGVGDLTQIVEANYACNRLGLDTITTGSTIACAMELGELGALARRAALRRRGGAGAAHRRHRRPPRPGRRTRRRLAPLRRSATARPDLSMQRQGPRAARPTTRAA